MTKNNNNKRSRAGNRSNKRDTKAGVLGMPTAWPGSSATTPGRAYARMVTEVFNSLDSRTFSKAGFTTWSSQIAGILAPYKYFRVCDATAEVVVNGGAASPFAVAFNLSNGYTTDTDVGDILNDDYAAVSTAMIRPKLQPPKSYWATRPVEWYTYAASGDTGYALASSNAGSITLNGTGGTTGQLVGYLIVDLVLEFHTLK